MNEIDKAENLINSKMPELAQGFEQEALDGDMMINNKRTHYACGQVPKLNVRII